MLRQLVTKSCNRNFSIKHADANLCINCVYHLNINPSSNPDFPYEFSKCMKFGAKDVVSGRVKYDFADLCRKDNSRCGEKGLYFKHSKVTTVYDASKIKWFGEI